MEKIKVLHITQSVGGVETYLRQVIQNIDRSKFDLSIVSCEPSLEKCVLHMRFPIIISICQGFQSFYRPGICFQNQIINKKQKPALVHLHSSKAGLLEG
jgi:hypothetical protein